MNAQRPNQAPSLMHLAMPKTKAANKIVRPVKKDGEIAILQNRNGQSLTSPVTTKETSKETTNASTAGLLSNASSQMLAPNAQPEKSTQGRPQYSLTNETPSITPNITNTSDPTGNSSGAPQTTFTPNAYQSDGYNGAQGGTHFNYDPSDDSLVENRINGLLNPDNALMRKAVSTSQGFMAQRGLQSSSIANESALSSMIDKALPIAQQDANTHAQSDQLGWQNSFNAEQTNLSRTHDAKMFDKQGQLQTDLQNNQFGFQGEQNNADRTQQVNLEALKNQNQQGLLDKQGQQELERMERNGQLTQRRDLLLQKFQNINLDKQYLQTLEMENLKYQNQDSVLKNRLVPKLHSIIVTRQQTVTTTTLSKWRRFTATRT